MINKRIRKISKDKMQLSKESLEKIKKELAELKTKKRAEIAQRIKEAKEFGDLAENADYQTAKEEQAFLEGRIAELENLLKNATITNKNGSVAIIGIGSTVVVSSRGREEKFILVDSPSSDPSVGKISVESPIGRALLGRRKGEEVEIIVPRGKVKYKILKIE